MDNCDPQLSERIVVELLPDLLAGDILLTNRLCESRTDVEPLGLDVLVRQDASSYLLEATNTWRILSSHDGSVADALVRALDGLALGIELAIAYINTERITLAEYLQRWRQQQQQNKTARRHRMVSKRRPIREVSRSRGARHTIA